jgi:bifunctional DNase/RNase
MSRMVEVVIDSVRVSLTNQQRIVVLRETTNERYLPIWIGPYEAEAITIALQEIEVARPQTHDLLKSILTTLNARLLRIEVVSLKDDVFYGNLVVEVEGRTIFIDSRPSDALALAARARVPILISKEVMDSAGVIPEEDLQNQRQAPPSAGRSPSADEPEVEGASERLSVFEDFLQNLDIDKLEDDEEDDADDDDPNPRPSKS